MYANTDARAGASGATVENFKQATAVGRQRLMVDHRNRMERIDQMTELLDERANNEGPLHRFVERETEAVRARFRATTTDDFEAMRVLGEGAFGRVHLVKRKGTEDYYALKIMAKVACSKKNHRQAVFLERNLLAEARNRWFVELFATFKDDQNLFMVMEFLQGGDLITHLIRKGRFSMEETRFYMAELLQAVDFVHRCGCIHRDVKPDNMVLSDSGHLKLLDFGLVRVDANWDVPVDSPRTSPTGENARRRQMQSVVGTPQYMAPEVFRGKGGIESDIWAIGIIAFECMVGHVPFHAGNMEGIQAIKMVRDQILQFEITLPQKLEKYLAQKRYDESAKTFLESVLCDRDRRVAADAFRRLPFFAELDFSNVHQMTPPIVPEVASPGDAKYFDEWGNVPLPRASADLIMDSDLAWTHYEFNREAYELQRPKLDTGAIVAAKPTDDKTKNPERKL